MKTKAIFILAMSLVFALFTTSCDDEGEENITVSGIELDQDSLTIEVDATGTLIATLLPSGASGDISWSSSEPSIASVTNGVVIGLSVGEATIAATSGAFSATCEVTVTPKPVDPGEYPSLNGSNYTVIQIDEASATAIESKIINDCRPDEENKFLYVWDGTFSAGTPSGLNFYDQTEGWVSFVVASAGWSGAGYNVGAGADMIDMTDMYNNPDDYVFHIGMKSSQTNSSFLFIFADGSSEAKVCVGPTAFTDNGVTYEPYADFSRDNEWHSVEIPATKLKELGVFYNEPFNDKNVFAFLAGGTTGNTLDFDACFFYKKATE